ncbi:MAG: fused MFS/spermidine synthase [Phycisphaerae bacterium]
MESKGQVSQVSYPPLADKYGKRQMNQALERKILLFLFFVSGISGLIYEIVWLRILSRVIGVTTYATAVTLAAFMLGLALGSILFGKLADKRNNQLLLYSILQGAIAITAAFTPALFRVSIELYRTLHTIGGNNSLLLLLSRVLASFILLLIPATLMGGTLPLLTSYLVRKGGEFGKNFSLLYGLNTFGSVAGVLLAGFITIGLWGEQRTINIGVLLNLAVGIAGYLLYKKTNIQHYTSKGKKTEIPQRDLQISPYNDKVRTIVLITIAVSGFTALSYEIIWSRQFILFLRTSTYAFSAMLAVFLTGIAAGSIIMNKHVDKLKKPLVVFGILEMLIGVVSISNLYFFQPLAYNTFTRLIAPIVLVFPLTFIFGAIFPVASLCYAKSISKSGTATGTLYCFNTVGNVAGSLVTGFLFFSFLGSSKTVILLGFINLFIGFILIAAEQGKFQIPRMRYFAVPAIAFALFIGLMDKDPFLDAMKTYVQKYTDPNCDVPCNKEYAEATVTAVLSKDKRNKIIFLNGVGQAAGCTETKLIAHLPILLAEKPRDMLVICFGIGTTLRSASMYEDINTTVVELVPAEFECFKYFYDNAEAIQKQKNIRLVADDGRNFLLCSSDRYDIISIDPSPPIYSAGTVNLYSQEFFKLCRQHLKENGIMCVWFPLDATTLREDRDCLIKTFHSVFSDVSIWAGPQQWGLYLIGKVKTTDMDRNKIEKAFTDPKFLADITEVDNSCDTAQKLLAMQIHMKPELTEYIMQNASIITDDYPFTEFPLWRWLKNRYFPPK